LDGDQESNNRRKRKPKRRVKLDRYIKSTKQKEMKFVDERPNNREERKLYRYLCPICFRYFNYMLDCNICENYVCISCAKDLIKQGLKKAPKTGEQEPEIEVRCPHC